MIKKIIKRIIKKIKRITIINEDQSGSNSDIKKLCEIEEELDNINEIEDSDNSGNKNFHNTYRKRKRMHIISDIESESEIKDADNEKNTVKAESHR